jgi:hypothetical protein
MDLELVISEPIVRGGLALFPVFSPASTALAYLTGPEAEAAGALEVGELADGAIVSQLVVHNRAATPLLLVEGETLVGAWQNRTLNVSVLVGGGARLGIPVSCVEASRWRPSTEMGRSGRHAPPDLRRLKEQSVNHNRASGLAPFSDQGGVWHRIDAYAASIGASPETDALDDLYGEIQRHLDAVLDGITPESEQVGVIVGMGGSVRGIDLFDKPSTFAAYWDGLVAGYAMDALKAPAASVSMGDAEAFVGQLLDATDTLTDAIGLGRDHVLHGDGITGHALEWDGAIVHLAAFATELEGC